MALLAAVVKGGADGEMRRFWHASGFTERGPRRAKAKLAEQAAAENFNVLKWHGQSPRASQREERSLVGDKEALSATVEAE